MLDRIHWRSFRTATWLGWQIESNWTDPFLFAVYSIVKPLSSAMILVMMYAVITQGDFGAPLFPYIYLGNAFYMYVGAVMTGVSWSVIEDREHYRTIKYIYTAPVNYVAYLFGRGVSRVITGSFSVFITITCGVLFLRVPITVTQIDFPLFIVTLLVGIVMLAMIGLLLAGVTLLTAYHAGFLGEATAGALYLFSGAVFPLDVLPEFLRPLGFLMPITYWLELLRRSLIGSVANAFPTLVGFSNAQLLLILIVLVIVFSTLSFFAFRFCDARARDLGKIDVVTNH
ncbi:MAG: ABC transporter permease [Chloroflexi bacterium]|nr:ABC transporter permease [Chloroflexota bacterium]